MQTKSTELATRQSSDNTMRIVYCECDYPLFNMLIHIFPVIQQGETGEAGNPGPPGEPGIGVSTLPCQSTYHLISHSIYYFLKTG